MKCKIWFTFAITFLTSANYYFQTGTFDFTGASQDGSHTNITQTVSSTLLTIVSNGNNSSLLLDASVGTYGIGMTGTGVKMNSASSTLTFTFNRSVNIGSIRVADFAGTNNPNLHFATNTSKTKDQIINGATGSTVSFGTIFIGITSITVTQNGGGSFQLYLDDLVMDASLPVELTSFTGVAFGNTVNLNWATATEVNNYGFNVETLHATSLQGTSASLSASWETLGFVQGHGNSNSPKSYSFEDKTPPAGKVQYRLKQIDFDGAFEYSPVVDLTVDAPVATELRQNFPNPFNPETVINYKVQAASHVTLKVFDMLGREVTTLVNGLQQAGNYNIAFSGEKLSSGIYYYRLSTGNFISVKKMLLIK